MRFYTYKAFGLVIKSEILIPELSNYNSDQNDVTIKIGEVPVHLSSRTGEGILFEASRNDFLLKFNGVGSYLIQRGDSITIDPSKDASRKDICLFLLGSVMGALLHQRGLLPIHGSCINTDNGALVISGVSSVGKSSLAAGLAMKGYSVLSDDISVVAKNSENRNVVYSGIPHIKLWKDILDYYENSEDLERVRPNLEKYHLSTKSTFQHEASELKTIIFLTASNDPEIKMDLVKGSEKFNLLYNNIYRVNFLVGMGRAENLFKTVTELINTIDVYFVVRPSKPIFLNELVSFVEDKIINC